MRSAELRPHNARHVPAIERGEKSRAGQPQPLDFGTYGTAIAA